MDAAAEEFVSQGYSRTTINAVAERMDMSKGALYGHFSSKWALADSLTVHSKDAWKKILADSEVSSSHSSALEKVIFAFTEILRNDVRFRAALRIALDASVDRPACTTSLIDYVREGLKTVVRQAQWERATSAWSPEAVSELVLMTVYGEFCTALYENTSDGETVRSRGAAWRLLFSALARDAGQS